MYRLAVYIRQIFFEDVNIIVFGAAAVLTLFLQTIGIFLFGIEWLLFPLTLALVVLTVAGPVSIILYMVRKDRSEEAAVSLGRFKSLVFGAYLGLIALAPMGDWDDNQRLKSEEIVAKALENYRLANGLYPADLSEVKGQLTKLPATYSWEKFTYSRTDSSYHLDIPVAIVDRWLWDKEKGTFVYGEF
jgi:hypothetical protein